MRRAPMRMTRALPVCGHMLGDPTLSAILDHRQELIFSPFLVKIYQTVLGR